MKTAIIGAGITGLYLAWKLTEKGEEVSVFEKRGEIGKEACSGLFSERILEFIPESQKLIQNQINYCLIHFPKRTLQIKFTKKFFVMNHFELDKLVADLAKKAGAKLILNYKKVRFDLTRIQKEFNRIIGCDGANSQVRKNLKLKDPQFYLGIQGFVSQKNDSDFVETWPTASGFLWKIPRGREVEYGIIEKLGRARKLFDRFLKKNNLSLDRQNSALVPQGLIVPKNPLITRAKRRVEMNVSSSITLCGDASGLTKPWSGGGVIWGLSAAEILLKNFPDFLKYQKELKKFFLPKIIFSKAAKKSIYFLGFKIPWLLPKNYKMESDFLI